MMILNSEKQCIYIHRGRRRSRRSRRRRRRRLAGRMMNRGRRRTG
jgi:hypothetical protein